MPDQVIRFAAGWYALVDGALYGPWVCQEYAKAGLQVEQLRAIRRADKRKAAVIHAAALVM